MLGMSWWTIVVNIVLGFILLGKGAEWLVGGSTVLARRMGVSAMVVGLTVVAWGTSLPEVVVSVGAALDSSAALSLGNVLGSNIANIGLVLGACAIVLPSVLEGRLAGREIFWFLFSIILLMALCYDERLSRLEGVALLGVFAGHTWDVFRQAKLQARLEGHSDASDAPLNTEIEVLTNIGERAVHWRAPTLSSTAPRAARWCSASTSASSG
jgi:cation:H+ antiporter